VKRFTRPAPTSQRCGKEKAELNSNVKQPASYPPWRANGADGISDIEHVAIGNGTFAGSDIEGKAAMGSGE
jgi:hypothetical protein